ncbi:MAG: Uma2 family endonuclease [Verrucomicrobiales bacterium]|jgi:Uma2 family endonuclease
MEAVAHPRLTEEEYLTHERTAEVKSEFVDGEIFAMAGGTEQHSLIAVNCSGLIHEAFKSRPCRTYSSDMKVRSEAEGTHHYPDLSALCGPPDFLDAKRDVLLNPSLIIEVLSATTEAYDRGRKFALYRGISSLREYVLVDQGEVRVDVYRWQDDGSWVLHSFDSMDADIHLESIDCQLSVRSIYDKVEFISS